MSDKTCKTCNNYDRETEVCIGEAAIYINVQVNGKPLTTYNNLVRGWFKPPPDFGCTYWEPRPCLKEYSKCDCEKCKARKDADRDEDSGVLK